MADQSAPPTPPSIEIENIPEQLTGRPQWVCWRTEKREGKPTKVPYTPGTNRRASSTDLMTWRTFSEALTAYESGEPPYDGIGFVFCSADPYVGVDLDNCRNPETGDVAEWAQKIMAAFADSYVEASPSGTGVHIIFEGALKEGAKKKEKSAGIEAYGQDRFFTITGRTIRGQER
jgi:putative DNA primase/helicase